ncbi:MAG: GLPGLI family protein [Flavobacterium sp.]
MKKYILIILLLNVGLALGQQKQHNLKIEYTVYKGLDIPYKLNATLYVKDGVSIWQEHHNSREPWAGQSVAENLKDMRIDQDALKVEASPCIKTDMKNKEILMHGGILKNWFLVKDNFVTFKWHITNESRQIGQYKCIKATTTYRGRGWSAWFTPEIPSSFGPWKLRGLPGVIIEAVDESNRFTYRAYKIETLDNDKIFKTDFATLMPVGSKKVITYQQFLLDEDEAEENAIRELSQQLNVSTERVTAPRAQQEEVKYEWEQ